MSNAELISDLDARASLQELLGQGYVILTLELLLHGPRRVSRNTCSVLFVIYLLLK
jgi:hypothetical protein